MSQVLCCMCTEEPSEHISVRALIGALLVHHSTRSVRHSPNIFSQVYSGAKDIVMRVLQRCDGASTHIKCYALYQACCRAIIRIKTITAFLVSPTEIVV